MIDVHQNAALSESFEGDRSRVIGNRCNKTIIPLTLVAGWMENAECGVRSAECGVWKMRSMENAECGKCGVWKMRSMENAECGKCGV